MERQIKKERDLFEKLLERIANKVVLLFGEPMVGKTTLAKELAKRKNTVWIKIDTNYSKEEVQSIAKEVYEVKNPLFMYKIIEALKNRDDLKDSLIVIDSLTTLASEFLKGRMGSPRANKELADYYDTVLAEFSKLKEKGVTVLVITHEALKKWDTIAPRMNLIALRHIDLVLRMYLDEKGERRVKVWRERKKVENPSFIFEDGED